MAGGQVLLALKEQIMCLGQIWMNILLNMLSSLISAINAA